MNVNWVVTHKKKIKRFSKLKPKDKIVFATTTRKNAKRYLKIIRGVYL